MLNTAVATTRTTHSFRYDFISVHLPPPPPPHCQKVGRVSVPMGTIASGCSWLLLLKSKSKWVFVFYRTTNYYTISSAGSRNSILQQTLQGNDVSCGLRCKHWWYSHPDRHWSKFGVWWTGRPVSELKKQKRNKQTKMNLVYDLARRPHR